MKGFVAAFFSLMAFVGVHGQTVQPARFEYGIAFGKNFPIQRLQSPQSLEDVIEYFPSGWIESWKSVVITASRSGKETVSTGKDTQLTLAQKKMLAGMQVGDHLVIVATGYRKNPVSGKPEEQIMRSEYTIVPDYNAKPDGKEWMNQLLREATAKLGTSAEQIVPGTKLVFTVDPKGGVNQVKVQTSSGDSRTDEILLDLLRRMNPWKPARDASGATYSQEFFISLLRTDC